MNPSDDFLLVMTESQLKRLLIHAIDTYIEWRPINGICGTPKQEVVDEIVTDCILDGKYAGEIG